MPTPPNASAKPNVSRPRVQPASNVDLALLNATNPEGQILSLKMFPVRPLDRRGLTARDAIVTYRTYPVERGLPFNHGAVVIENPVTGQKYVARAGPSGPDEAVGRTVLRGENRLIGEVKPIEQSEDTRRIREGNKRVRVRDEAIIRGRSAEDIVKEAEQFTQASNAADNRYLRPLYRPPTSNSYATQFYQNLTGARIVDQGLLGARTTLRMTPRPAVAPRPAAAPRPRPVPARIPQTLGR